MASTYFFSIQPFWSQSITRKEVLEEENGLSVCWIEWERDSWFCVPGNGQIGILIGAEANRETEEICYGVLKERKEITAHGITKGYLVRFSPGRFSQCFSVPADEIPPEGMSLSELLPAARRAQLMDTVNRAGGGKNINGELPARRETAKRLAALFEGWGQVREGKRPEGEERLAAAVQRMIWDSRGSVRMKELEQETGYSARRIQEVMTSRIGVGPKQLCCQTRFQHALMALQTAGGQEGKGARTLNLAREASFLGYSDQAHYNREFKKFCGICPKKYRELI